MRAIERQLARNGREPAAWHLREPLLEPRARDISLLRNECSALVDAAASVTSARRARDTEIRS